MAMAAVWVRAAVTAVELVGDDPEALYAALPLPEGPRARLHREQLRAAGDRSAVALAVAVEGARLARLRPVPRDPTRGARLLARWMRALDPDARARAARALSPGDIEAVRGAAGQCLPLDPVQVARLGWIVGRAHRQSGVFLSASQWTELLDAADGRAALVDPAAVRIERLLRLVGRDHDLRLLAAEVGA